MNVDFALSEFRDDIDPDDPYVNIEKIKKQKNTTDEQQPIVLVTNVPQQAGLEGVGSGYNPATLLFPNNGAPPARGDRAAGAEASTSRGSWSC